MPEWKKLVVSGSNISQLNNDANYVASTGGGIVSGSSQIDGSSITNNTVSYGGISVALGGEDATPAFDLQDATNYPGDSNLVTVGTISTGVWQGTAISTTYVENLSGTNTGDEPAASTTVAGIIELATNTEANTGTATNRAVTPANLGAFTGTSAITTLGTVTSGDVSAVLPSGTISGSAQIGQASATAQGIIELATSAEVNAGSDGTRAVVPSTLALWPGSESVTTLGTISTGVWNGTAISTDYVENLSGTNTGDEPDATATVKGIVELATNTEANTGTDTTRAVTPANLGAFTGTSNIVTLGTVTSGDVSSILPAGVISGSAQLDDLAGDVTGAPGSNTVTKIQGVAITSGEATQLANIGSTAISAAEWGYLGNMDQDVTSTSNVNFGNLTLSGDLTVQGSTTSIETTNLAVDDKMILLNSGSAAGDSGIIFGGSVGTANRGMALMLDDSDDRLVLQTTDVLANATAFVPSTTNHYSIVGVFEGSDTDAATAKANKIGNMRIESNDIYVFV